MYFVDQEHKERFVKELKKKELGFGVDAKVQACLYIATAIKQEDSLYSENFGEEDSVVDFGFALIGEKKGNCAIDTIEKMSRLEKRLLIEALKIEGGFVNISLDEDEIYTYEV